jgi:hypothetical protein
VSNEDETHGFEGFLVDRARRKQAAQRQAPTRAHDINRSARFDGATPTRTGSDALPSAPPLPQGVVMVAGAGGEAAVTDDGEPAFARAVIVVPLRRRFPAAGMSVCSWGQPATRTAHDDAFARPACGTW